MMTLLCPSCRRVLPDEIIDDILEAAEYHRERSEDMMVGLECPCGRRFTFALDTTTLEPLPVPEGMKDVQ